MNQQNNIAKTLSGVPQSVYGASYLDHLLQQYLKYLEMSDKISDRRSYANTFFLSINTGLISAIGIANLVSEKIYPFFFSIIGIAAILLCYSWYRLIRSYRDLNTAKFKVIHEIENLLPIRPFNAEWEGVGRGEYKKLYLPFTHIELFVPWIFVILYISLIIYSIFQV